MNAPIERDGRSIPESIIIPAERSPGFQNWIKDGAYLLEMELPFSPPADVSITIGSGLTAVVDHLSLQDPVVIPFASIGLPVGKVAGHQREIIAGITPGGKKAVIVNGRTHAYEIPPDGVDTQQYGRLSVMELATGYLSMLDEIGVGNAVLTCAAGGIAHSLHHGDIQPFFQASLPVIGVIASDINLAYPSAHLGPFEGYGKGERFIPLQNSDRELIGLFSNSMIKCAENTPQLFYYATSSSTPSFEDEATVYDLALRGVQVVGMSYSYEKEYLSGAKKIPRFLGIAVVTNNIELKFKEENPEVAGNQILSVEDLRYRYPHDFRLAHPATHEEVLQMGLRANDRLGRSLALFVEQLPI